GEVGRGDDRLERRLAGGAGQRRGGPVDGVDARFDGGDVGAELAARRVVGVQVDGQVEALAEGGDQRPGGGRAQQAGHVLDAQDVDARLDELLREPQVVVEGVETLVRGRQVAGVAEGPLDQRVRLEGGVDRRA